MDTKGRCSRRIRLAAQITPFLVSYLAFAAASSNQVNAQASPPEQTAPTTQPASPPAAPATQPASPSAATEPAPPPAAPAREPPSAQSDTSSPPAGTPAQPDTTLPQVTVEAPRSKPRPTPTVQTSQLSERPRVAPAPVAPPPNASDSTAAIQAAWPASQTQDARTGTVGGFANSTSAATKINTPLANIPQAVNCITREFVKDTGV